MSRPHPLTPSIPCRSRCRPIAAVFAALSLALATAPVSAASVVWPDNIVCGAPLPRADRPAGPQAQHIPVAAGRIAYYRFGHGSPLLLVTGYRSTMAEWNAYFLQALAREHEVVVFDLRGVGASTAPDTGYRMQDLAHDVAALMRALDLRRVTLLGWSMGGMVAQQAALDDAGGERRIARLVLLSSMPPGPGGTAVAPAVLRTLSGGGAGHFGRVMRRLFPAPSVPAIEPCFVADMFAPTAYDAAVPEAVARAQAEAMAAWHRDRAAARQMRRLRLPVLAIGGDADAVLPRENAQTFSRLLPRAERLDIRGGGHALMYQYPYALAGRINAFIAATGH